MRLRPITVPDWIACQFIFKLEALDPLPVPVFSQYDMIKIDHSPEVQLNHR